MEKSVIPAVRRDHWTAPAERANVRGTRGLTTSPSGVSRKERAMTHSSHTSTERLDEIEARANAAPGQVWSLVYETPTAEEAIFMGDACAFLAGIEFQHEDDPDPTFIEPEYLPESYHRFAVHARADVPALVAALRDVLEYVNELDGTLDLRSHEIRDLIASALEDARP